MITVVVVDDEVLLRSGLASLFDSADDLTVIGAASNGADAVTLMRELQPDVVLMDIRMPGMDGLEAIRRIVQDPAIPSARVLILTTFDHDDYLYEALRAGARGFVLESAMPDDLQAAVRVIASGDGLLAPSVTRRLMDDFTSRPESSSPARVALLDLTDREQDVLTAVAKGFSIAEICVSLHMSLSTAKTHISHLLLELGPATGPSSWCWPTTPSSPYRALPDRRREGSGTTPRWFSSTWTMTITGG